MNAVRELTFLPLGKLKEQPKNPKAHAGKLISASLARFGYVEPMVRDDRTGRLVAGHGRLEQLRDLKKKKKTPPAGVRVVKGEWLVPVLCGWRSKNDKEASAYLIASNRTTEKGGWIDDLLAARLKALATLGEGGLAGVGYDQGDLDRLLRQLKGDAGATGVKLSDRFVVPPFTVLDGRAGYWSERKRHWLDLGIESELGRADKLLTNGGKRDDFVSSSHDAIGGGTSVFDPVLCELVYRWFCPEGGRVLDPFAGGSVRGIVAARLGLNYLGNDLRAEQAEVNRHQARRILGKNPKRLELEWHVGDSADFVPKLNTTFDLVFTCPPYGDLEQYSDDAADLSTMDTDAFAKAYTNIVVSSLQKLKPNRFAVFVVGNYRDAKGFYVDLVGLTISAAGLGASWLYNDAVLLTPLGTLPMRTAGQFPKSRKLGKAHQNVLVFFSGDPSKIRSEFGDLVIPAEALALVGATPEQPTTAKD